MQLLQWLNIEFWCSTKLVVHGTSLNIEPHNACNMYCIVVNSLYGLYMAKVAQGHVNKMLKCKKYLDLSNDCCSRLLEPFVAYF